jgi:ATP-dependent Clp protease protease subunit
MREFGPPPDLPSLLLANRIIYIGMPIVPSVTELVLAQLLYLNQDKPKELITMYINSMGTNSPDGRSWSFDTEAFAIADAMMFITPPIRTICVGQACGTAAMLLGLGNKGQRCALPNSSIMLNQPKSRMKGQVTDVALRAKEILNNRKITNEFLAKATGKDITTIERDSARANYLSAEEAVQYGLVDKVLYTEDLHREVSVTCCVVTASKDYVVVVHAGAAVDYAPSMISLYCCKSIFGKLNLDQDFNWHRVAG